MESGALFHYGKSAAPVAAGGNEKFSATNHLGTLSLSLSLSLSLFFCNFLRAEPPWDEGSRRAHRATYFSIFTAGRSRGIAAASRAVRCLRHRRDAVIYASPRRSFSLSLFSGRDSVATRIKRAEKFRNGASPRPRKTSVASSNHEDTREFQQGERKRQLYVGFRRLLMASCGGGETCFT